MSFPSTYKARQFNLSNLQGISDETLEMHFKLYEGYVKETNKLNEKIAEFVKGGKVDQEEFAEYSELNRRLGFEYNGMVLHDYKPADRPKYIEAFFSNIDWSAIDKRLHKQMARQLAA